MSRVFPLWAFLPHLISGNPAEKKTKKQKQQKKKAATIFCLSHKPLCQQYWCCRAAPSLTSLVAHEGSGCTLWFSGRWWETDAPCPLWGDHMAWDLKAERNLKYAQSTNSFFSALERLEALELSWMLIFFFPLCRIRQEAGYGAVGLSWKMNVAYWMPFIMVAVRNRACCQGTWMDYRDANLGQFSNQHLGVKAFLKEMK